MDNGRLKMAGAVPLVGKDGEMTRWSENQKDRGAAFMPIQHRSATGPGSGANAALHVNPVSAKKFAGQFRFLCLFLAMFAVSAMCAAEPVEISGITEPFMDVTLGFADAGIIHSQFFKEGDAVKKGDVILELDKRLETFEVARRKAVMDQNKMVYDSTRQLADTTKSVSQEDLEKAEADFNVATADYQIAEQQLSDRQLVAPFSGLITEVLLKPGAAVAPYQPLVRLVDTSRCYFVGHIDGVAAGKLDLDEQVSVQVDGGQTVSGKICFISPVVDAASGLCRIKAIFDNPDGKIRPGLAAKMTVK